MYYFFDNWLINDVRTAARTEIKFYKERQNEYSKYKDSVNCTVPTKSIARYHKYDWLRR